jgi:hypothetical protein
MTAIAALMILSPYLLVIGLVLLGVAYLLREKR